MNSERWNKLTYVEKFDRMCFYAADVFKDRNASYGSAFETTGVLGATSELIGCISKLHNMVFVNDPADEDPERIRDVFVDIHNFANIGRMMLEEGNLKGRNLEIFLGERIDNDV